MGIVTRSLSRFLSALASLQAVVNTKLSAVAVDGVTIIGNGTPVNPLQVVGGGTGSVSFIESPAQTWTSDSTVVFPHGLSVRPTTVQVWLRCVVANNGYAVGDRIQVGSTDSSANNRGFVVSADLNNIYIRIGTGGIPILNSANNAAALSGSGTANWLMYVVYPGEPGALADGDKGDITVSAGGSTWTIDPDAVTYAKFQNATAGNVVLTRAASTPGDYAETALAPYQLLGRGAGNISAITLGSNLSMAGTVLNATGGSGLTQVVVSTNQMATAGELYTFTGLSADRTLTLPASAAAGDRVGVCLADRTYSVTIALNGLRYQGFENDRILVPGHDFGLVVVLTYVNAAVGWNSSHFIPAKFWTGFTTWWDMSALGSTGGVQGQLISAAGNGRLLQRGSGYIKSNKQYRGRLHLGVDFNATVGAAYSTFGDLAEADHAGNLLTVVLFQVYTPPSTPYFNALFSKFELLQRSWSNYANVDALGNPVHGFSISGNGATSTIVSNANYLDYNTTYLGIGYYDGTAIGSVVYGGAYNGATATVAYNAGIYNSTASVECGAFDNASSGCLSGWIGYAGSANLTYTAAIGEELGAGLRYPWNL